MRINKVALKLLSIGAVLALVAAPLANLIKRQSDPFKPSVSKIDRTSISGYYNQKINWNDCFGGFKCATYRVPIDYGNIKLGEFDIAVMKHLAPNSVGNLIINPGGPGGSGVDYTYSYSEVLTKKVVNNFNIVGFDPRGVARSAPIECLSDKETDESYSSNSYPETKAEFAQLRLESAEFAKSCSEKNKYLKFYSTANAARDMDILRALLGDKKLMFLGKSYGTYLGTLYAKLFPDKVGRLVLDGALDPTLSSMEQSLDQAVGFDSAFKSFIENCSKFSNCAFSNHATIQIQSKLDELRKTPIKVGKRKLTESLAMYGIAMGLYDKELGWPELRIAFKALFGGNGKPLLNMADQYTGRDVNGGYLTNEAESLTIITCNDFPVSKMDLEATKLAAPFFGKYVAYSDVDCSYLPKPKYVLIKEPIQLSAPVLIIGTTKDPATPYKWAVKLSDLIINSKLLSLESDGHTGYNRNSECIDETVENYLISGVVPAQKLVCKA